MSFTDILYLETKDSHRQVDKHPFVSMIRKDKIAGDMYINFNKICIYKIQEVLKLKDINLQSNLYREFDLPDIYISPVLQEILTHCKTYPLESAYQFYLGLLFGGNMLKRMLPEHNDFLTYENSIDLINDFKTYLCNNVDEIEKIKFIENVNVSYKLIKKLFDEFYDTFKHPVKIRLFH
jgi:hypothetical protein